MKSFFAIAIVLSSALGWNRPPQPTPVDEVEALVAQLIEEKDEAEVKQIQKLAKIHTKQALEGLMLVYDEMGSLYMQRAVLRSLASFDGNPDLEHTAAIKIRDAITLSKERELRMIAIRVLAGCNSVGKAYLASVVNAPVDYDVREVALHQHIARSDSTDIEWYFKLYAGRSRAEAREDGGEPLKADNGKRSKGDQEEGKAHQLESLREISFDRLALDLELDELMHAIADTNVVIRTRAMGELENRGSERALEVAEKVYSNRKKRAEDRLVAARIIKNALGEAVIERFLKDAVRADQSERVSMGLAELLLAFKSPVVEKASIKLVGKGRGQALRFSLRLAAGVDDPKVDKALLKLLKGKDEASTLEAIRILVARDNVDAMLPLRKLVSRSKNSGIIGAALGALGQLSGMQDDWITELLTYAEHEDLNIRNAAISSMATSTNERLHASILQALEHENGSTRLVAGQAIQKLNLRTGVGAMAMRMQHETGRLAREFAGILFDMTGKPFGMNGRSWEKWWLAEQEAFEIISERERKKKHEERELNRLKRVSKSLGKEKLKEVPIAEFFGVEIESSYVLFIIDTSGSMQEYTRGEFSGEKGPIRMEVAKRELKVAIDALSDESFFNIITFSGGVNSWNPSLTASTEESRSEAKEYADSMRSGGGTNLFGALEYAFVDTDVDTIYVLSDGDPSAGAETDPFSILRIVDGWNENRKVILNCVAIGDSLDVLKGLSERSGGSYVYIP